jgi:hypothetical protein
VGLVSETAPPTGGPAGRLHPAAVLHLLADETRLRVLGAAVLGAVDEEAILTASGLPRATARRALDRLVSGGLLVNDEDGRWQVSVGRLKEAARRASGLRPELTPEDVGATAEQAAVLRGFLVDGKLTSIPVARRKRMVMLDWLAQRFEPGKVYPESQVNRVLQRYHDDFAALRRYLVDEEFLERREGFYWRAGGTFELD